MEPTEMENREIITPSIEILTVTDRARDIIYAAYKQCYSSFEATVHYDNFNNVSNEEKDAFIADCIKNGHLSPLEHASFSFAIYNVSRALSHQLVRHRLASFSQKSQRDVSEDSFRFVMPDRIGGNEVARNKYYEAMAYLTESYRILCEHVKKEDARYILPNATATSLVMTMNCRELLHFIEERCCRKAHPEIRKLSWGIRNMCSQILPCVFRTAGPKCYRLGYCPEKNGCGEFPRVKDEHIIKDILSRLEYARMQHPTFATSKQAAMKVILEELNELIDAAEHKEGEGREKSEALDVVATALRYYLHDFSEPDNETEQTKELYYNHSK